MVEENRDMRIAINTRFLLKNKLEGLGNYALEIFRRMVKNNPQDEFHFIFDRPFDKQFIFGENVESHVLFPPARHPFLWHIWYEWALPPLLKKINPDVFVSPDGVNF